MALCRMLGLGRPTNITSFPANDGATTVDKADPYGFAMEISTAHGFTRMESFRICLE